jgi:hypothetical protein
VNRTRILWLVRSLSGIRCVGDGLKTDETCRFENHWTRKLNGSATTACRWPKAMLIQSGGPLHPDVFSLLRRKEETLALLLEENVRKDPAKPWISNWQVYVGFGTVLTPVVS